MSANGADEGRTGGSSMAPAAQWLLHRDVVLLRWPSEAHEVERLASARLPRLLLVEADADPPEGGACEEDWIRLPATDRDIGARLTALRRRAGRHPAIPELDDHGRLHHRGSWVSSSPIEQRLLAPLVERFGAVVTREELLERAWPGSHPTSNALRVHMTRVKRRVAALGLDIRGVRPGGYALEEPASEKR